MSNQHDPGDIIFVTPAGGPITELRQLGNHHLALYTEDNQLLHDLREWTQLIRYTRYTKEVNGREVTIAVDMIFPRSTLPDLLKKVKAAKTAPPAAARAAGRLHAPRNHRV